jgi:membrane associated rhomboid family serine protease
LVDLNHIFLFLAIISPIAVLARSLRTDKAGDEWRIPAAVVLGVTMIGWILRRNEAGYIGAGAWFALLFVPAIGLRRVAELAARRHYGSAQKIAAAVQWLHPSTELRQQVRVLGRLDQRQRVGEIMPPFPLSTGERRWRLARAPAVTFLIVINIIVFGSELAVMSAGVNEGNALLRLGAIHPVLILIGHQYWRLLAALFLHAGVIHLLFNLFALYVLGPPFERQIGSARFLLCYLGAGLCSSAGVVILWRIGLVQDAEVVGASGCVMGIVGAWAASLIRDHQTPLVRRRLANIVTIVVIQTIFDITTPQVSMAAHLCGLVGGFMVGFLVAPRSSRRDWHAPATY